MPFVSRRYISICIPDLEDLVDNIPDDIGNRKDDNDRYDGQHPSLKKKEEKSISKPPKFGKCPQCYVGDLVGLFGVRKYCNNCGYKE